MSIFTDLVCSLVVVCVLEGTCPLEGVGLGSLGVVDPSCLVGDLSYLVGVPSCLGVEGLSYLEVDFSCAYNLAAFFYVGAVISLLGVVTYPVAEIALLGVEVNVYHVVIS